MNKTIKKTSRDLSKKLNKLLSSIKTSRFWRWIALQRDIYPVLVFSLVPALIFWSRSNIQELSPQLMARPLMISAIFGLVLYGLCYWILGRDKLKASLLTIATIFFTFSYQEIHKFYTKLTGQDAHLYLLLIIILVITALAVFLRKRERLPVSISNYLALFATLLLVFNLYPLMKFWTRNTDLDDVPFGVEINQVNGNPNQKPDIYYLIFDRYANQKVLKSVYNFDNTPFLQSLRSRGFYVANDSTANYPFTTFSLATSLNLSYLPDGYKNRPDAGYYGLLKQKIEDNKVAAFLKDQGYSFINIGPWWTATKYNSNADEDLYYPSGLVVLNKRIDLKEHELLLFQKTIFWPFFSELPMKVGPHEAYGLTLPETKESAKRVIHRQSALHQFETIKHVSTKPGPKFIFAHLLFPHDPYVNDAKCNKFQAKYDNEYTVYLEQLKCANTRIQETVDHILRNSPTDPIIVLQSDEGPYPLEFRKNVAKYEWAKAPVELLHQKAEILNAYYFPDRNYSKLQADISPVNSFRVIFNQYLGTNLEILDDRHYFPESEKRRFFLLDMTDKF